ncbi:nuclear transport factor 2 family protein [Rhodococcus sp. 2H158]
MAESVDRVLALLAANDAQDAQAVASAFAAQGELRFGNFPTVRGADAVCRSLTSFFSGLDGIHHDVLGTTTGSWSEGEVVSVEAEVTYTRHGRSTVGPLPVTSTVRLLPDLSVASYRIYMDPCPVTTPTPDRTPGGKR